MHWFMIQMEREFNQERTDQFFFSQSHSESWPGSRSSQILRILEANLWLKTYHKLDKAVWQQKNKSIQIIF